MFFCFFRYDKNSLQHVKSISIDEKLSGMSLTCTGDRIYIVGLDTITTKMIFAYYHMRVDEWIRLPSINKTLSTFEIGAISDEIYLFDRNLFFVPKYNPHINHWTRVNLLENNFN